MKQISCALLISFFLSVCNARAQQPAVGLRDGVGLGVSLGAPTALIADIQLAHWSGTALAAEAYYGANVTIWGIGEGYGAGLRLDVISTSDGVNDALVLSPAANFITIVGQPTGRGWINFAPYSTIWAVVGNFGVSWVHQYDRWSLRTSCTPGLAVGLEGVGSDHEQANRGISVQLSVSVRAEFPL